MQLSQLHFEIIGSDIKKKSHQKQSAAKRTHLLYTGNKAIQRKIFHTKYE